MPVENFKFVSPGIFINEIDNSQLPAVAERIGPLVIGRAERGPALRPVQVESFSEFVEIFGNPIPGGRGGDIWRDGNYTAPTYAVYAAQAWLRNNTPLTFVRLLGDQHLNASSAGYAGWKQNEVHASNAGGAYGLWVFDRYTTGDQSAGGGVVGQMTASLAAVFYTDTGTHVMLSGGHSAVDRADPAAAAQDWVGAATGQGVLRGSGSTNSDWIMLVKGTNGDVGEERINFNFTRTSDNYIRKVFNTNPTLLNTTITSGNKRGYWLGETYDSHVDNNAGVISYAAVLGHSSHDLSKQGSDWNFGTKRGETGYFIAQDLGSATNYKAEHVQQLFKLVSLDAGEQLQKLAKVSIVDIKPSTNDFDPYGTFTVAIRLLKDSDKAPVYLEKFSNCSLNPNSSNYVARKIGDMFSDWDDIEKRYKHYGAYPNASKFVRVAVNDQVAEGVADPRYLPVGVIGPKRFRTYSFSGSAVNRDNKFFVSSDADIISGASATALLTGSQHQFHHVSGASSNIKFQHPALSLRVLSTDDDLSNPQLAFWGVRTNRSGSTRFDESIADMVRIGFPGTSATPAAVDSTYLEDSFIFTLDDVIRPASGSASGSYQYVSGSRKGNYSLSAQSGSSYLLDNAKVNRFTTVFAGGFDGLDIKEREPFRNTKFTNGTELNNYAFYSVKRAIDAVADPEVVEFNLATIPGVTNTSLTEQLIKMCEDRADALAIIDLEEDYVADTEGTSAETSRMPDAEKAVTSFRSRGINSSYGCAYFPWVQIRDTLANQLLWAPPSIVALGTMAFSERQEELWFAPAGFTRGGLSEGAAGIPVTNVRLQLTSRERDRLYSANINPIASFPAEGLVVFGQKTLQVTPSALDRINVRRLLIHLKKEVSRIAATTLFEQNVQATWNRFSGQVEVFLNDVKAGLGLTDFKVVLDESTTTPELIDRNILYAKVFLKPARAIEFIALDFVITDTGASFAD